MGVLYADLAFLLNGCMDYLALRCTAGLSGLPVKQLRLIAAAVFGAFYGSLAALYPVGGALASGLAAGVMVILCFGWSRLFLRRYVLFWMVSCALAGLSGAVQTLWLRASSPWVIFAAAASVGYGVLAVIFGGAGEVRCGRVRVQLQYGGRRLHLVLLRDSGNLLRDPFTGQVLCIVWKGALAPLLAGQDVLWRTLPYRSLGTEEGELRWFYCDAVTVGGVTHYRYPVGVSETEFSPGYAGLWSDGEEENG